MNAVTPLGFRDVLAEEALAREGVVRAVQDLFAAHGYVPIETPTLEVMDVMRAGGRMPASPFKFFDSQDDLLAMRPDVTLQIARMCATRLGGEAAPLRFRYTQRVFREAESDNQVQAREFTQCGVECIGVTGATVDAELVELFAEALALAGVRHLTLGIATVGVLRTLLERSGAAQAWCDAVLEAYHDSDFVVLDRLCDAAIGAGADGAAEAAPYEGGMAEGAGALLADGAAEAAPYEGAQLAPYEGMAVGTAAAKIGTEPVGGGFSRPEKAVTAAAKIGTEPVGGGFSRPEKAVTAAAPAYVEAVRQLARIRGGQDAIDAARALAAPLGCAADLDGFQATYDHLVAAGLGEQLLVDFSVISSFNYYTGIVFEAVSPFLGAPLGSGGRYDRMIGTYGADRPAAGFAFCLEQVASAAAAEDAAAADRATRPRPLRIAVPKGSLNAEAIACLAEAGLDTTGLDNPGRALVISNPGVDYIIVRPSDAPVFVALGAADCGICGKDSLLEVGADVVELVDLRFGGCRFVVAEAAGTTDAIEERYRKLGSMRVATKYPSITRAHFARTGTQVEIVCLHGNVELAPMVGLAERIVDITATGTTLAENNLEIVEEVLASTARFFANGCALRTDDRIVSLARALAENAPKHTYAPIAGATNPAR